MSENAFDRADQSQLFDRDELLERLCGDEEILSEIMDVFFDDTPKQMKILNAAASDGDTELVYRQAHTIKGASGNVAALEMKKIAYEIEMAGRRGDLDAAKELLPDLERSFTRLKDALSQG